VLCLSEGVAVTVAHGYAKSTGRPMAVLLHDVVGLQNATMSLYNAWCDRVPMLVVGGTGPLSKANRRPWIDWIHTAGMQAEAVRNYTKWDDQPHDLESVPESFARAWTTAVSAPPGPVYWCLDVDLQEQPLPAGFTRPPLAAYAVPTPPAPREQDLRQLAERLRHASLPLLVSGYAGATPQGFAALLALAELLHSPVLMSVPDSPSRPRIRSPPRRCRTSYATPTWSCCSTSRTRSARCAALSTATVRTSYTSVRRTCGSVPGPMTTRHSPRPGCTSPATPCPALEGLVRQLTDDPADRALVGARELRVAGAVAANRAAALTMAQGRDDPAAVPVERLLAELRTALDGVDFVLGNSTTDRVEHDLWDLDRAGQWAGHTGGGGLGYGVAASIGVALAVPAGTVVVDVQGDGDLLYAPQALWTAARLALPLLVVVHDNRCYGNTAGHLRRVAADRGRPAGRGYAGNALDDPAVDLAGLARSLGVAAWGPISDAAALATAFKDAIETVRAGRPALVDVLTPGGPGTS
jgi:thiamine pyrophosphate-dependent acetolactate synthase large subunit-like protein